MNKFVFLAVVFACLVGVSSAALSESTVNMLKTYDSRALNDIWRAMVGFTFYKLVASYVCSTQALAIVSAAGLFDASDVEDAIDTADICNKGFEKVYAAVWYRYDDKVYTFGNDDQYNYTF